MAPGLSLAGVRLVIADLAVRLPVLRTLSLCACCRTTPVQQLGVIFALAPSHISLPRYPCRVGLHIGFFEACSAFTHVAACTRARSPKSRPLSRGFRHFVTSMPAPVASGWSGCRVGLAPTGERRLARRTGHATISNCSFNRRPRMPVSGIRRHGYDSCWS
jgi:hypothetical protein